MELSYYINNFWADHGDAEVSQQLIDGPWKPMFAVVLYAFFALHAGPKWMRDRKPYDLRPWMLVYNGFMFGVNGAGVLVALWVTQMGTNSWSADDNCERWQGVQGITAKYLGFVFICVKITDFMITIFDILRKRDSADIKSRVIHDGYAVIIAYMGLKFYPRGFYWWYPLCDCFSRTIMLAYYVLSSAGSGLRFALWWKNYMVLAQIFSALVLASNALYVTVNGAGPMFLSMMILVLAISKCGYYTAFRSQLSNPSRATCKAN